MVDGRFAEWTLGVVHDDLVDAGSVEEVSAVQSNHGLVFDKDVSTHEALEVATCRRVEGHGGVFRRDTTTFLSTIAFLLEGMEGELDGVRKHPLIVRINDRRRLDVLSIAEQQLEEQDMGQWLSHGIEEEHQRRRILLLAIHMRLRIHLLFNILFR